MSTTLIAASSIDAYVGCADDKSAAAAADAAAGPTQCECETLGAALARVGGVYAAISVTLPRPRAKANTTLAKTRIIMVKVVVEEVAVEEEVGVVGG